MTQPGPAPDSIRAQVERITASDVFRRAERQCRFLRYIVGHSLAGTTDRLKGYTIGLDVFDRGEDFDANLDSIVRVEAGRLRAKLRDYYQFAGRTDPILIDLPRGAYAPSISLREDFRSAPGERVARSALQGSVAVLPFRNLSADPEQEFFCDGLTDTVITALARQRHLKVISLTSVMRYKTAQRSIPDIGAELNVGHVVEGTVVREGNRVRVSAQLIEVATDHHVWADAFEREMSGVIGVQRELADTIAVHLLQELAPAGRPDPALPVKADAVEAYLLGRGWRRRLTRDGIEKAAQCFNRAIALDMNFAAAWGASASCYCVLGSFGFELETPRSVIPRGLEYSRRAMELDPDQVEPIVYTAIMTLKYEWNWPGAEQLFRAALALCPNDSLAHLQYGLYHESLGRFEQACLEAERGRQLAPLSTEANMYLAWQLHQAGRDEEALSRLLWTLDLNPDFWAAHWGLGHAYLALGRCSDAITAFRRAVDSGGGHGLPLQGLGYACAVSGDPGGARDAIAALERLGAAGYVSPCCRAAIHAGLGEADRCFALLEEAFTLRSRSMAWLNVSREYHSMRSDPRFPDLVGRIGIPAASRT